MADDVIIVTSSLTKDMTGKEDGYRAAAIRALCKITDSSMLQVTISRLSWLMGGMDEGCCRRSSGT